MWIVFCWKETTHCLQYRRIHTLQYSFPVRQYQLGFQITWCILHKKNCNLSCGLWAQTKMEAKKRWASNLMKCNKCSIACTYQKSPIASSFAITTHWTPKKYKWSIKKKPQNVLSIFCWWTNRRAKATTWQLSLHRKIQIPWMI